MVKSSPVLPLFVVTIAAAIVSSVYATPASAEETVIVREGPQQRDWMARPGLQLGARLGFGAGTGVVYSGFDVNTGSYGSIPVIVDLGVRVLPQLYIGGYGQFATVFPRTNGTSCPRGFDCSIQDWRFGLEADFHPLPQVRFDPYIGIGFGYEVLQSSVSGNAPIPTPSGATALGAVNASTIDRGWELASITIGSDFRLSRVGAIGLFVTGTLGQYDVRTGQQDVRIGGNLVSSSALPDVDHSLHELFIVGARGTFDIPFVLSERASNVASAR